MPGAFHVTESSRIARPATAEVLRCGISIKPMSQKGHLRHFECPLEVSAVPPIATKNGEPLKRRRANGNNFSNRFPQIVAALTVLPVRSCLIDGEAIVCNESGLAVFDLIRGYRHDAAAVLCAFDLLNLDGQDLRRTPIETRKRILGKLLNHPREGIAFNEHCTGDGAIIFKHARALGCEGIVSKRRGSSYRSGRTDHWVASTISSRDNPERTRRRDGRQEDADFVTGRVPAVAQGVGQDRDSSALLNHQRPLPEPIEVAPAPGEPQSPDHFLDHAEVATLDASPRRSTSASMPANVVVTQASTSPVPTN